MNKYYTFLFFLAICIYSKAQVGINTKTPITTLDIKEKRLADNTNDSNYPDGILIPKLTKNELALKDQGIYTPTSMEGILVYVTNIDGSITGPSSSQVEYITSPGYYYLAPDNKWRLVAVKGSDSTNDAWVNNATNKIVELGSTSKGSKRNSNTNVAISDTGNLGLNNSNPLKRLDINLESDTNESDAFRVSNLKTLPFLNKSLVINNDDLVGIKSEENIIGDIQRFPINKIESIAASVTKPILIDSTSYSASNLINTITESFIPKTTNTGIILPPGIYKLELKIVGYFQFTDTITDELLKNSLGVNNSVEVKILINGLEYSSQHYGSNTKVENNENNYNGFTVMDLIELNNTAEIDFTITNNTNTFTVLDYIGNSENRIYGSLILIQRLK